MTPEEEPGGHQVEMTPDEPIDHQVEMVEPDCQVEMIYPTPSHQVEMAHPISKSQMEQTYSSYYAKEPSCQVETTQLKLQTTSGGWIPPCLRKTKSSNIPHMKGTMMKDLDKYNKDFKNFKQ